MDRAALAHKCERIEKAGGSVLDYLRSQGCISPWGTWHRLQREELCRKDYQIRDGKGNELMKRYTAEQKQKAIDIALSGENPRPYLRSIGCSKPDALWHTIKKALKESDPETYARIPNFQQKINVGAEALMGAIPEGETVTTCCARSTAKGVEVPEDIGSDPTTVRMSGMMENLYDGLTVTGLKTDYGEFRLSNNGYLYFGANQHDELEMPAEIWQRFAADLPRIMGLLGIN